MNCANFTRQTWWMRGKCTMQSYSRYLFNVIEREYVRATNLRIHVLQILREEGEGGGRKNRNICNFCNPFESIRNNTYIHVSLNYPNLVGNVQDKYIHARIPRGGCTYTVVSNILARPPDVREFNRWLGLRYSASSKAPLMVFEKFNLHSWYRMH